MGRALRTEAAVATGSSQEALFPFSGIVLTLRSTWCPSCEAEQSEGQQQDQGRRCKMGWSTEISRLKLMYL